MIVESVTIHRSPTPVKVSTSYIDQGYLQGNGGSLPDVDIDYQSDRRQEVKDYLERRYNKNGTQRVFSAGTFTTLKVKAVIKDVARTMRIPVATVNYITAMFDDDKCDFAGIFKEAHRNKKIAKFIGDYPELFEAVRTIMFQPRSSSVHASALLITPETMDGKQMECFDYTPIKKVDGLLVSEFDGYQLDELGLLKNDCLATKELSKIQATMKLCNENYGVNLSLEKIAMSSLDDEKVYRLIGAGFTQNIFQLSSAGMTKFLKEMRPTCIGDIIAANALYRPATLESGATEGYVNNKRGLRTPSYRWGTYNALKETYGLITYQEQVVLIAREVGGFSLGDGVNLVKFISKKKVDKIKAMKDKFMSGASERGCPSEDAVAIWNDIEACGSYLFNKSHATAYAITSYVGGYLKANYPTAFYTVALQWADDNEISSLMSEMSECSQAKVVSPDINKSRVEFFTDYNTQEIFWSLTRIKMVGIKAAEWIVEERERGGEFTSVENFINRVFKYKLKKYEYWDDPDNENEAVRCPVNARHIYNMVLSGCFDKLCHVGSVCERYGIAQEVASLLGVKNFDEKFVGAEIDREYFWETQQISLSGIGSIDYKRIYNNSSEKKIIGRRGSYKTLAQVGQRESEEERVIICATVAEVEEKSFVNKKTGVTEKFAKITLQQNNDVCSCVIWPSELCTIGSSVFSSKGKIVITNALVKCSDYEGKNGLQLYRNSIFQIINNK